MVGRKPKKYLIQIEPGPVPMFKRIRVFKRKVYGNNWDHTLLFVAEGLTGTDVEEFRKDLRAGTCNFKGVKNYEAIRPGVGGVGDDCGGDCSSGSNPG